MRALVLATAIAGPLLVATPVLLALAEPPPPGAVHPAAARLARRVENAPDMVILGNSKVETDLDVAVLSRELGGLRPAKLGVDGTGAPVWYAVLKRRVADAGIRPKVVMVYGGMTPILQTESESAGQRLALTNQLGTPDPVVQAVTYGEARTSETWARIDSRRTEWRNAFLDTTRDLVAGAFFAPPGPGPVRARGASHASAALARVFELGAMANNAQAQVGPIVERVETRAARLRPVEETYIDAFADLAREIGAQLVFVRAPYGPGFEASRDPTPEGRADAAAARMREVGAAFIDGRTAELPAGTFGDGAHMTVAGRSAFSGLLGGMLREIGAGSSGPLKDAPQAARRARPAITRVGEVPIYDSVPKPTKAACGFSAVHNALAPLSDALLREAGLPVPSPLVVLEDGRPLRRTKDPTEVSERCAGAFMVVRGAAKFSPSGGDPAAAARRRYAVSFDPALPVVDPRGMSAWWLYPGTRLRLQFAEAPTGGTVEVDVVVRVVIPGPGPPRLRVGGGPEIPFADLGTRWHAMTSASAAANWTLDLVSPQPGPVAFVEHVMISDGGEPFTALGRRQEEVAVPLLRGQAEFQRPAPTFEPSVRLRPHVGGITAETKFVADVPDLGAPSIETTWSRAALNCSPLDVLRNGVPLRPATPITHSRDRVVITAKPGGPDLVDPAASYRFALLQDRSCRDTARWHYAGDTASWALRAADLAALREAATELRVLAYSFGTPSPGAGLRVELDVDGAPRAARDLAPEELDGRPVALPLEPPLAREASEVRLRVRSDEGLGLVLLASADLVEPAQALFGR